MVIIPIPGVQLYGGQLEQQSAEGSNVGSKQMSEVKK